MEAKKRMGRPTIFKKADGVDVHGKISKAAAVKFEKARKALAGLSKFPVGKIGDGDVVEFLVHGESITRLYLKGEI